MNTRVKRSRFVILALEDGREYNHCQNVFHLESRALVSLVDSTAFNPPLYIDTILDRWMLSSWLPINIWFVLHYAPNDCLLFAQVTESDRRRRYPLHWHVLEIDVFPRCLIEFANHKQVQAIIWLRIVTFSLWSPSLEYGNEHNKGRGLQTVPSDRQYRFQPLY